MSSDDERSRPAGLWAALGLFAGYPLWWLLGLGQLIFPLLAGVLALVLVRRRLLRAPVGFGAWLVFLALALASATQIDAGTRAIAFAYRYSMYASATLLCLYVVSHTSVELPRRRFAGPVLILFATIVIGGWLGLFLGDLTLQTPVFALLPGSLRSVDFVQNLVTIRFAQVQFFLGFPLPRPSAPFPFTNAWGAVLSLVIPLVLGLWSDMTRRQQLIGRVLLGLVVIPAVVSVNRGLWVTLIVAGTYVAIRTALRGRTRTLRRLVIGASILAVALVLSPLGSLVGGRLEAGHSDNTRLSLYTQVEEQLSESPVLGFGSPKSNEEDPNRPAVGTHGQIWGVLFSHGVPAAAAFCLFAIGQMWRTRHRSGSELWLHALLLAACVHLPFYDWYPVSIHVIMLAVALLAREPDVSEDPDPAVGGPVTQAGQPNEVVVR